MPNNSFFVDRRRGRDRRLDDDPCRDLPVDLFHRKRRKSNDRRAPERSLIEDYYAYVGNPPLPDSVANNKPVQ